MKKQDLAKKSKKDLENLLTEKKESLSNFRFGVAGSNVKNVKEGRELRKDIARIKTLLNAEKLKPEGSLKE